MCQGEDQCILRCLLVIFYVDRDFMEGYTGCFEEISEDKLTDSHLYS